MAFIPRSSNQFHCYRSGLRFVKRKQEADPPNTSWQQQNISQNLVSCRPPASPAFRHLKKGIEIFCDFALTPAIRLIPSYQHIWNPWLPMYPKTKTERIYSSPGRSRRMTPFSFLGSSRPQIGPKSDGLLASLLVKREQHWGPCMQPLIYHRTHQINN